MGTNSPKRTHTLQRALHSISNLNAIFVYFFPIEIDNNHTMYLGDGKIYMLCEHLKVVVLKSNNSEHIDNSTNNHWNNNNNNNKKWNDCHLLVFLLLLFMRTHIHHRSAAISWYKIIINQFHFVSFCQRFFPFACTYVRQRYTKQIAFFSPQLRWQKTNM